MTAVCRDLLAPRRVVFHRDFDGSCAAAIFVRIFGSGLALEPVGHEIASTWLSLAMDDAAVVDFPFHPTALWWFDHHETSFFTNDLRAQYAPSSRKRWAPEYLSCPPLVISVIRESHPMLADQIGHELRHWIGWANKIDAGLYKDPQEALYGTAPELLINAALEDACPAGPRFYEYLVSAIASGVSPDRVAENDLIHSRTSRHRAITSRSLAELAGRSLQIGDVGVGDMSGSTVPLARYAIYTLFPQCRYGAVVHTVNDDGGARYKLSVGANPWFPGYPKVQHDIGEVLRKFGGGGHAYVGSAAFSNAEQASVAMDLVISHLNTRSSS